jgi:alkylation response protein AidB-like acyl-CoA dehydrogenase
LVAEKPQFVAASMFGATATATEDGDELVVTGRWPFNSGSPHADYLINGFFVMDEGKPRIRVDGMPDWRFGYFDRHDAEVVDTWHVSGLRGTGSHDTAVSGARIPVERTIAPLLEPAKLGGPMFRLPFTTLLVALMSGFPLGVARRSIDELVALAQTKSRAIGPGPRMVGDEIIQYEVAKAEAALKAARALVVQEIGVAMEMAHRGDPVDMRTRAEATMAALHSADTARGVVDTVCQLAGGGAIYESSPLQRCARDIAAGTAHGFFSYNRWKEVGRVRMGLEPTTFFI